MAAVRPRGPSGPPTEPRGRPFAPCGRPAGTSPPPPSTLPLRRRPARRSPPEPFGSDRPCSKFTTTSAPDARAASSRAPRPTAITRAAPRSRAMRMAMSPIGPGPITATVPPGRTPDNSSPCSTTPAVSTSAPSRKLIVVRHPVHALDRVHFVLRIGAVGDEAVVTMAGLRPAVVLADRVAPLHAVGAVAAAAMRLAGDAIAGREIDYAGADGDDFARPFVPGNEGIARAARCRRGRRG